MDRRQFFSIPLIAGFGFNYNENARPARENVDIERLKLIHHWVDSELPYHHGRDFDFRSICKHCDDYCKLYEKNFQ